jgi:hypothetical protein
MWAEFIVLRELEADGWQGVWINWCRAYWCNPCEVTEVLPSVSALIGRIAERTGRTRRMLGAAIARCLPAGDAINWRNVWNRDYVSASRADTKATTDKKIPAAFTPGIFE